MWLSTCTARINNVWQSKKTELPSWPRRTINADRMLTHCAPCRIPSRCPCSWEESSQYCFSVLKSEHQQQYTAEITSDHIWCMSLSLIRQWRLEGNMHASTTEDCYVSKANPKTWCWNIHWPISKETASRTFRQQSPTVQWPLQVKLIRLCSFQTSAVTQGFCFTAYTWKKPSLC